MKQAVCFKCDAGRYTNMKSTTSCLECPLGFAQPKKGEFFCDLCGKGKYNNEVGALQCKSCPPQSVTQTKGAISDALCVCDQEGDMLLLGATQMKVSFA